MSLINFISSCLCMMPCAPHRQPLAAALSLSSGHTLGPPIAIAPTAADSPAASPIAPSRAAVVSTSAPTSTTTREDEEDGRSILFFDPVETGTPLSAYIQSHRDSRDPLAHERLLIAAAMCESRTRDQQRELLRMLDVIASPSSLSTPPSRVSVASTAVAVTAHPDPVSVSPIAATPPTITPVLPAATLSSPTIAVTIHPEPVSVSPIAAPTTITPMSPATTLPPSIPSSSSSAAAARATPISPRDEAISTLLLHICSARTLSSEASVQITQILKHLLPTHISAWTQDPVNPNRYTLLLEAPVTQTLQGIPPGGMTWIEGALLKWEQRVIFSLDTEGKLTIQGLNGAASSSRFAPWIAVSKIWVASGKVFCETKFVTPSLDLATAQNTLRAIKVVT